MRKTYHICLSSHDEVMFRSEADLCRGFNALALAILETDSRLLAEGILTTHFHELVQTDCPEEVIRDNGKSERGEGLSGNGAPIPSS